MRIGTREEVENIDIDFSEIFIMYLLSKSLNNTYEGVQFLVNLYARNL